MNNPLKQALEIRNSQVSVKVERHLALELSLLDRLDQLNLSMKAALAETGANGLSIDQAESLSLLSDEIALESNQLKKKRLDLVEVINEGRSPDQSRLSIRLFITTLDSVSGARLEAMRQSILDRVMKVQSTMLGHQAVLFYSFDFYRRMVAGLLRNDQEDVQYRVDGQTQGVKPGKFYRRAV